MLIKHDALIPFPLSQVYDAFLAGMEKLPPWLPSIDKIEITRFELAAAHQASVDYKWYLDNTIVPVLLRPFLKQNMDHICSTTLWCAQRRVVEFEFYHAAYRDLFDCKGTFSLLEHSHSAMRIEIYAELNPYPERMPGLPVWVAKRSLPLIEKLIGDILKPSLLALPAAVHAITSLAANITPAYSPDTKDHSEHYRRT